MKTIDNLILQLKRHEGLKLMPYRCTEGKLTFGHGRNLEDNPLTKKEKVYLDCPDEDSFPGHKITEIQAGVLLINDIKRIEDELNRRLFFHRLNEPRQGVLINMAFNLGVSGMMNFKKMIASIMQEDFANARDEMLDSKWANQVPRRANELAEQMLTGKW